ncbi:RHS repeat-associated core domain-containing protein [Streptomyces sp. ME01-18h]|uniref:RHS repeat-associated core domain-containing protein n=1 Tax=Streptomyces sp. ME01-18h TaxID=462920 RepID=UPI0029BC3547|nr:RHS repeat-associated core domain-containing protein [Streptomyces sp. ME01-18h]MDX3404596.1 polymorphic toxin-type HINT domain-containing protein [Streptomyces sp. ME01-18h]
MALGIGTSRQWGGGTRHRTGRLLAQSLALALIVPTGLAQVAQAVEQDGLGRPDVPESLVTKVKPFDADGAKKARAKVAEEGKANEEQAKRATAERDADWPGGGTAKVPLKPKADGTGKPAGVPVTLSPAAGSKASAAASGEARVTVLGQKAARRAGVTGVLLTAEAEGAGTANVRVDYGGFASAIGGGWSQRLRLVRLPACALTTPEKEECRKQTPLASSANDLNDQTVSATVSLEEASGGTSTQLLGEAGSAASSGATVLAVTAAAAGSGQSPKGAGDYSATKLAESSSWQAGGSSGSFTWSYDFTMPPAAAGPVPPLSLSYDSGSVDGRTATTNNQTTSVGEGFALTESYVTRAYGSCDEDGHDEVYDQCWKYDNASLVLNGKSTRLVRDDDSGVWHLADDDASKVTRSTGADNGDDNGEYWTVVTGDGTKYVFGKNKLEGAGDQRTNSTWTAPVFGDDSGEPGYGGGNAFADRDLVQAWRWNLDYVEDTHGNAATYWYTEESNYYKKNKADKASTGYTRGGYLNRIEYGLRKGALFTDKPDAKVTFSYAERCTASDCDSLTEDTADNWPDVPFDAICSKDDDECDAAGPSFFTRKRLTGIDTFSYNADSNAHDPVDSWDLTQKYLDGGDIGDSSDQVLTLTSLKRVAKAGDTAITVDPVAFTYQMRPNRVDATDDILPLTRPRISTITSETGGITEVTLSAPECVRSEVLNAAPDTNTRSCFPQYWHINGAEDAAIDWFHKYRVTAVGAHDAQAINPAVEYAYSYSGAAWHYNDDPFTSKDERTWSDWRGYRQVTAYTGRVGETRSKTVSLYMQGMHGDKKKDGTTKSVTVPPLLDTDVDFSAAADSDRYKGALRQQVTYNGSQPISSVFKNYTYKNTATQTVPDATDHAALWVRNSSTYTSTYLTGSKTWRTRTTGQKYDDLGMVYAADDWGQAGLGGDETCTRTWYARNPDLGITSLVSRTRTVAKQCSVTDSALNLPATSATSGDVLADTATVYDKAGTTTWQATQKPTKGEPTWTGRATGYAATAGSDGERLPSGWQTGTTTTYDALGRSLTVTDTAGHKASTAYTPADTGPLTKTTSTDPKGYRAVNFLDPRRGQVERSYDINLKKTEQHYDALGRLTEVWLPNRSSASQSANVKFTYHIDKAKPSWVSTATLTNDGSYTTSYTVYDSLLRPLQKQAPTPQGGRLLTDTHYDTRGLAYETFADMFDSASAPNGTYTRAEFGRAPTQTEVVFDGAGRPTTSTLYVGGVKKWATSASYTGDSTATTALDGGSAQRTITDVRGLTIETRDYAGESPADADFGTGPGTSYTSTKFTYTAGGKQRTITGPDGAKWSYGYDLFGRQTSADDPDKGRTTTGYNALDQIVKATDSRGKSVLSAYDELGRPTGTWAGSKTDANQLTGYTYDTLLKGLPTDSTRYLGGKAGAAYTQAVTAYDTMGRPTGTELRLPDSDPFVKAGQPATLAFESHFNIDGTLKQAKDPALGGLAAETVGYDYNALGNLTDIGTYLTDVDYSALAEPQMLTLGTGDDSVYVANTFEAGTRRLTRSYTQDETHPYQLQDLHYGYDQAGNVTSIADPTTLGGTSSAETQCFTHDAHQRLTEAWTPASQKCADAPGADSLSGPAPYWTSYTYNAAGQRTTETEHTDGTSSKTTYCYTNTDQPHTLSGTTTTDCAAPERTYTYDTLGNTTARPGVAADTQQNLTWSEEGRLTRLTEDDQSTDYVYGADGALLVRATENGERVLYAGATELHLRPNGTTWAQRYYAAADLTPAMRSNQTGTDKVTFLVGDHHGTSHLSVDRADQQLSKRYTTPFGEDRGKTQYGPWPDDKGFLGKTRDTNTGLTHVDAREYDPSIGQFVSVDPLLEADKAQTLNGYSYAANNPTTLSDPTGTRLAACEGGWNECGPGGNGGITDEHQVPDSDGGTADTGGTNTTSTTYAGDGQPIVDGIRIPAEKELRAMGLAGGYPESATYNQMLTKWADRKCYNRTSTAQVQGFCDTAARAGVLTDPHSSANDPWGAKATWHCLTGRGDCGEAIVSDIITVATMAFGSVGKSLSARGASRSVAAEAEESAVALLLREACSFDPATPVLLESGETKPIGEIEKGDKVATGDPRTGDREGSRTVTALIVHRDNDLVDVTVRTADGKTSTIQATSRHPFWDDTLHAWVRAADLQSGHLLNTAADTHVSVIDVRNRPGSADMYNLSVSDLHTYYVLAGDASVLVHNSGCAEDVYAIEDHVIPRHTRGGAEADATKSLFDDGVDLGELAAGSAGKIGRYQAATGNIRYVITGKKIVGADRRGLPTKTYTIVREGRDGELITMHPGLPRDLEP